MHRLATQLIRCSVTSGVEGGDDTAYDVDSSRAVLTFRRLLTAIQQRRLDALQKAIQDVCKDEDVRDEVEQLIISLSVVRILSRKLVRLKLTLFV